MEVKEKVKNPPIKEAKDKSKIYFFIIAIAALLMTNVYFYVKFKSSGEKLYTVALQKEKLQIEVDRIEAELDYITNQQNVDSVPQKIVADQEAARKVIADLRKELDEANITDKQIQEASNQIERLKNNVTSLKDEIESLRFQNEILQNENTQLENQVNEKKTEVVRLKEDNTRLSNKVSLASSIKVSNIVVNGVQRKRNNQLELESKAKRVDELQVRFSIADNELSKMGRKEIFVRVIDPQGNLIAKSENVFYVHGDKLQFTFKESINFTNNGEEYEFLWKDSSKFKKGAYTVLLYADNAIMGRSSVLLK